MADVIYLTDSEESYLYQNFISVANDFNVPVEIIKCGVVDNTDYWSQFK